MEKRRIDLDAAGVRVVNVALILQGIREGAAKRRNVGELAKLLEFQRVAGCSGRNRRESPHLVPLNANYQG